jgi:hypothetical protein
LYYFLLKEVGPALSALSFYLSPAFAVILGIVFLNESVRLTAIIGLITILGGSLLAASSDHKLRGKITLPAGELFHRFRTARHQASSTESSPVD